MKGFQRVLVVFYVVLATREALAAQHAVTWDLSSDFSSWSSGRTFKVGDHLVFKYTPGLHSVIELSGESEYKSCDIGNAVDSMNSGNDVVKLNKPGTRYFACGTLGHCDQGMKLKIKIVASNQASSQESSSSTATSTPTPTSAASGFQSIFSIVLVFAMMITINGALNMV